jgi:methylated-DNA-protein-cysteine methyltransferase related protein
VSDDRSAPKAPAGRTSASEPDGDGVRGRSPRKDSAAFDRRVTGVIVALGEGEVVSYGDIAHDAGYPGRARAVGALLAREGSDLPWWRVVRGDGRLVAPSAAAQAAALRAEGVTVRSGRVVAAPRGRFSRPARSTRRARSGRSARSATGTAT